MPAVGKLTERQNGTKTSVSFPQNTMYNAVETDSTVELEVPLDVEEQSVDPVTDTPVGVGQSLGSSVPRL